MQRSFAFGSYQFSIDVSGDHGSPVIALHSGGMSSRQWKRLAETLEPDHRVHAVDFIGYGASTPWRREQPFHYLLDVVGIEALIDDLGESVHLVGHSYGGLVALTAALHRPRAVRSLSLVEPVAFGVLHAAEGDDASLVSFEAMPFGRPVLPDDPGAAEKWLAWFVNYWNGEGGWDRIPERMRTAFLQSAPKIYGEVVSLLTDRTTGAVWSTINAPTQLIHGEQSPRAAQRVAEILARSTRSAPHVVHGAGHMSPLTHESDVNAVIVGHIARND